MKSRTKFAGAIVISFIGFLIFSSSGVQSEGPIEGVINSAEIEYSAQTVDTIRVLSWNIAWGHGEGSDGTEYKPSTLEEQQERLQKVAELIRQKNVDIVLLQEVDFDSDRSHNSDQLELLSLWSALPYRAELTTWKAQYVPYPGGLNFSSHWGKMDSGAGVLSRFPIEANQGFLYEKSDLTSFFYNLYYPFRFRQEVTFRINGLFYKIINNHLEAFIAETRMKQASELQRYISSSPLLPPIMAFGGDFNSIPKIESHRELSIEGDFRTDSTLAIIHNIPGYTEAIADSSYLNSPIAHFTYPGENSTKRLDYIFVRNDFTIVKSEILNTGGISDHRPVLVEFILNGTQLQP